MRTRSSALIEATEGWGKTFWVNWRYEMNNKMKDLNAWMIRSTLGLVEMYLYCKQWRCLDRGQSAGWEKRFWINWRHEINNKMKELNAWRSRSILDMVEMYLYCKSWGLSSRRKNQFWKLHYFFFWFNNSGHILHAYACIFDWKSVDIEHISYYFLLTVPCNQCIRKPSYNIRDNLLLVFPFVMLFSL